MVQTYGAPAPPRRRARWPWVLLVVALVLVGLAVAADRVARGVAEDKAATALQTSQNLSEKPDVSVAGFPFLTQYLEHEFDEVTVTTSGVEVGSGDRALRISSLVVHLHRVTFTNNASEVDAETATADGTVTYAALSRSLGVQVSDGGNGRLVAEPSVTVGGQKFSGRVSAVPHATAQDGITFDSPKVSALGANVPQAVADALAQVFSTAISLAGLPFNVEVTGAEVTSAGLELQLTGRNLTYHR